MARNTDQVLLGPGYMYVAPATVGAPEAPPTFTASLEVTTAPGGNWEDVGYSEDGWALAGSNQFSFWTPAEEVDPIVTVKDSAEYFLRGVLAQFTLENLQLALSGGTITQDSAGTPGSVAGLRHYIPSSSSTFSYFSALFITAMNEINPGTTLPCVRHTYLPFVVSVAEAEIQHTKGANPSTIGLELRAIKQTGSDPFRIDEQFAA